MFQQVLATFLAVCKLLRLSLRLACMHLFAITARRSIKCV